MDFRQSRKSTLGSRPWDHSVSVSKESVHKSSRISNHESSFSATFRNIGLRPGRKSMLGTHRVKRESIVPLASDSFPTPCHNSSQLNSTSSRLKVFDLNSRPANVPLNPRVANKADTLRRDISASLPDLPLMACENSSMLNDSQFLNNTLTMSDIRRRESLVSLSNESFKSCDNSFNLDSTSFDETLAQLLDTTDDTLQRENLTSVLCTSSCVSKQNDSQSFDDTLQNETLKVKSLISPFNSPLRSGENSSKLEDTLVIPKVETKCDRVRVFSPIGSSTNIIRKEPKYPKPEETLKSDNIEYSSQDTASDTEDFRKLLTLMDTWITRNTESVNTYEEQIKELRLKAENSNKEIEDLKKMRQLLTSKLNVEESGKENRVPHEFDSVPVKADHLPECSPSSPSRQVIQEMRSAIKFLKTPRMSRAPRASTLLTPHSMSFCIKSQYEQLLE